MQSNTIGVVLVTFNRLKQLKMALASYEAQSCIPKYIVIVNNNSTDGTNEYLDKWRLTSSEYEKYIINLEVNTGGSGGFYAGLKKSLDLDANWIWVADDDAYPDLSAIEIADKMIKEKTIINDQVSAICGTVINNSVIDVLHRRRIFTKKMRIYEEPVPVEEYKNQFFELNLFSYVGAIINKNALKESGLPKKDYFIYYDDIEHSMRLQNNRKNLCFPAIKIVHDSVEGNQEHFIDWKYYYVYRNRLDFYKTHFSRKIYLLCYLREVYKCYSHIFTKRNALEYKIRLEAAKDAHEGKLGVHEIYKPGWKFKKKG